MRKNSGFIKIMIVAVAGQKLKRNCEKAPITCQLIEQIPDAAWCKRGQVNSVVCSENILPRSWFQFSAPWIFFRVPEFSCLLPNIFPTSWIQLFASRIFSRVPKFICVLPESSPEFLNPVFCSQNILSSSWIHKFVVFEIQWKLWFKDWF